MREIRSHKLVAPSHRGLVIDLTADELPCPWCGTATTEDDADCSGCGRTFG